MSTTIEVTMDQIMRLKLAVLSVPDDERLTGEYADLWAMLLQAQDRLRDANVRKADRDS